MDTSEPAPPVPPPQSKLLSLDLPKLKESLVGLEVNSEPWMEAIICALGYKQPHPWQIRYANCISNGRDLFLSQRTGAGKSVLVTAPILAAKVKGEPHIAIDIIPTRSLMNDQVSILYLYHSM